MASVIVDSTLQQPHLGQDRRSRLVLPSLSVVSYKGPGDGGGVSLTLEPLVRQLGVKVNWIGVSGLPDENQLLPDNSFAMRPSFAFHKVKLSQDVIDQHSRFCTDYLMPLLHGMPAAANFDQRDWVGYQELNTMVSAKVLKDFSYSLPSLCWVHDYHLAKVAQHLVIQHGIVANQFWHVPWPSVDVITTSPIGLNLVEALLANSVLGFHTVDYALNFMKAVKSLVKQASVNEAEMTIHYHGRKTQIVSMPLGIDFAYWQELSRSVRPRSQVLSKEYALASQVLLGIDTFEPTKGMDAKLEAIELYMQQNPSQLRRFHYVQLVQKLDSPSRELADSRARLIARIEQINKQYAQDGWQPIVLIEDTLPQASLSAWYQCCDVLLVTPKADGLNLIAKEFVASREDELGVLILSRQAGSSYELSNGALLVSAFNAQEITGAIGQALAMGVEEKRKRMLSMRHVVSWNQLKDWAINFLSRSVSST